MSRTSFGVCPDCGFDAAEAVRYQCKQNGEELTPEEHRVEVVFYLEESHPDLCRGHPRSKGIDGRTYWSPAPRSRHRVDIRRADVED